MYAACRNNEIGNIKIVAALQEQLQWWPMLKIPRQKLSAEELDLDRKIFQAPSATASLALLRQQAEVNSRCIRCSCGLLFGLWSNTMRVALCQSKAILTSPGPVSEAISLW